MRSPSRLALGASLALAFALVASAAAQAGPLADVESEQEALFDHIQPSVVVIANKDGMGSGFFISPDGYILTNRHVVGKDDRVDVVLPDGTKLVGKVAAFAPDGLDLALVKVARTDAPALALAGTDLRVGAWVGAVGHGLGGVWAFNTGMVSNIYPIGDNKPLFQTQIPLNPGNSGGPIFDKRGRVVGVVTSGIKESNSINFAIRVDTALLKFPALAARCECLSVRAPKGTPIFVDDKLVGQGPLVVLPAERKSYEVMATVDGKIERRTLTFPATRLIDLGAKIRP